MQVLPWLHTQELTFSILSRIRYTVLRLNKLYEDKTKHDGKIGFSFPSPESKQHGK